MRNPNRELLGLEILFSGLKRRGLSSGANALELLQEFRTVTSRRVRLARLFAHVAASFQIQILQRPDPGSELPGDALGLFLQIADFGFKISERPNLV